MKVAVVFALLCVALALSAPHNKHQKKKMERELKELEKKGVSVNDLLVRSLVGKGKSVSKRGAASIVNEVTAFDANNNPVSISVEDACLKAHNEVRALHQGTPSLVYDQGLANEAASWALEMATSENFRHSGSSNGENLYYQSISSNIGASGELPVVSPAHAVFSWYEESWEVNRNPKAYDYSTEAFSYGTGHFTQVVWKETSRVGCGVAYIESTNPQMPQYVMTNTYIVAQYKVAGNMQGDFLKNVRPLKKPGHPNSGLELEPVNGCLDYGRQCHWFSGWCSMMGNVCGCTCGA